jgi:alkanesulfonate monooxygenase SsuD/methylene tetrahydromethanopterin reductase-like flavin-dependent oxidoreductase (luciferase family)
VEYGAHLPLIDFGTTPSLGSLKQYARTAASLGYRYLCANDHLLFSRPWLDGPTALAAVIEESQDLTLATTVALPVIRGPVQLAKTLTALDVLSDGRLLVGVGPGSSAADYAAAGVPFDERRQRFDEAVGTLVALLEGGPDVPKLEPRPAQRPRPPVWVASWGSRSGLDLVARRGDGWLASAYNTRADRFRESLDYLSSDRQEPFPNGIATAWLYITEDTDGAEPIVHDMLAPMLNRPAEQLSELLLPIGPAELCAERLHAFAQAGAQRIFLWPLREEVTQLALFQERVAPYV